MSFSADVKSELCKIPLENRSSMLCECYGMLLFASRFTPREIIFKTENFHTAQRFETLISALFNPIIEKRSDLKSKMPKGGLYKVSVVLRQDCRKIYEEYGHNVMDVKLRINRAVLESEDMYIPFLRGVFLSCGSVTDPRKGYHLELSVSHKTLADNLILLINEVDVFSVNPKVISRKGGYVVYIKGNDNICDFLALIGASGSVMTMIETSAYKEIMNKVNRRRNSELANIQKLADASAKQIVAINKIKAKAGLDALPPDLKQLALLRLENPHMSLKELGESLNPPISRSGVNHRIQRLLKTADNIDGNSSYKD